MNFVRMLFVPALAVTLAFSFGEAEAKRLGGGKSTGMSRDSQVMKRDAAPASPATPAQAAPTAAGASAAAPAAAAAAQKGGMSRWLGPIAGLAAGIGLAAMLSHFGLGEGFATLLMLLLLGVAAFFVIRLLMNRMRPAQPAPAYAGGLSERHADRPFTPAMPASAGIGQPVDAPAGSNIPPGFDVEGFLRQAKLNFLRLQAANDKGDIDDLRQFLAPELFAEVRMQYEERGRKVQSTDVQALTASLLDLSSENDRYIASVRFTGRIVEDGAPAELDEVWHLVKPVDGSSGWIVAGIQQWQ